MNGISVAPFAAPEHSGEAVVVEPVEPVSAADAPTVSKRKPGRPVGAKTGSGKAAAKGLGPKAAVREANKARLATKGQIHFDIHTMNKESQKLLWDMHKREGKPLSQCTKLMAERGLLGHQAEKIADLPHLIQASIDNAERSTAASRALASEAAAAAEASREESARALAAVKAAMGALMEEFAEAVGGQFNKISLRMDELEAHARLEAEGAALLQRRAFDAQERVLAELAARMDQAFGDLAEFAATVAAPAFTDEQATRIGASVHAMVAEGMKKYLSAQARAQMAGQAATPFGPHHNARAG